MSTTPESQIAVRRIVQLETKPRDLIEVDGRKFIWFGLLRSEPFKSKYGCDGSHDSVIGGKLLNREPEIIDVRWQRYSEEERKRGRQHRRYIGLDFLEKLAKARQQITCNPKDFDRPDSLKCTREQANAMGFHDRFLSDYSNYHTRQRKRPARPHPALRRTIKCGTWFDGLYYRPWFWKKDLRKILDAEPPDPRLWVATGDLPKYRTSIQDCRRACNRKVLRLDGELMKPERFPSAPEKGKRTMMTYWPRAHVMKLGQQLETSDTYEFRNSADGETYIPFQRFVRMSGANGYYHRRWFNLPNPSWGGLTLRAISDVHVKLKHQKKTQPLVCLSDALAIAHFLRTGIVAQRPVANERAAEAMARIRDIHEKVECLPGMNRRVRSIARDAKAARRNTSHDAPLFENVEAARAAAEKGAETLKDKAQEQAAKEGPAERFHSGHDESEGEWTVPLTLSSIAGAINQTIEAAKEHLRHTGLIQKSRQRWIVRLDTLRQDLADAIVALEPTVKGKIAPK